MVETGECDELFNDPVHPYTRALLAAVPDPDPDSAFDFAEAMAGAADGSDGWPAPYCDNNNIRVQMRKISATHFVRVFDADAV